MNQVNICTQDKLRRVQKKVEAQRDARNTQRTITEQVQVIFIYEGKGGKVIQEQGNDGCTNPRVQTLVM